MFYMYLPTSHVLYTPASESIHLYLCLSICTCEAYSIKMRKGVEAGYRATGETESEILICSYTCVPTFLLIVFLGHQFFSILIYIIYPFTMRGYIPFIHSFPHLSVDHDSSKGTDQPYYVLSRFEAWELRMLKPQHYSAKRRTYVASRALLLPRMQMYIAIYIWDCDID